MTVTHTWNIRKVEYETENNSVKCLHWSLNSEDGNDKAHVYGCAHLSNLAIMNQSAVTQTTMLALLFRRLSSAKETLEEKNRVAIIHKKETTKISMEASGTSISTDDVRPWKAPKEEIELPNPSVNWVVSVVTKTSTHPRYGLGSNSAYSVAGPQGRTISLKKGFTYRFDQSDTSNRLHPLRIFETEDRSDIWLSGVDHVGTPGTPGAFTQITVPETAPDTLWYQCQNHDYMGGRITVS